MAGSGKHGPAAFLSYAHADDHGGGVARFIEHLNREIRLHLGSPFDIFLDRKDLKWGDDWKRWIDDSLDSVTFLIAVLSPSFLGSTECVRELERFLERERELGRDDLVFSVLWIEPRVIPEERRELWETLQRRQYTDWRRFRNHRSLPITASRQIEALAQQVIEAIQRLPSESKPAPKAQASEEAGSQPAEPRRGPTSPKRSRESESRSAETSNPQPGVGATNGVPDILWREIPGGKVEIAGREPFDVAPFRMAAYPVTNAQFEAFAEAEDGYRNPRWREGLPAPKEHWTPETPKWSEANHPRETVSWYEATAFCRWLAEKLGYAVRLPDEHDWQWAAQSAEPQFVYPWDTTWKEGLANTREAGLGRTSAVGAYAAGDSRQKVSDLAGNVLEWCRNEYANPKNSDSAGTGPRALRGGSWYCLQDDARADFRFRLRPSGRDSNIGFRVVCSSPIR